MTDQNLDSNIGANEARPTFLTVLCILSFISAGLGIVALLLGGALMGAAEVGMAGAEAEGAVVDAETNGRIWIWLIIGLVLTLVSLFGVIKMWKLQKQGFMIYTGAAVAGVIVGLIGGTFSVFGAAITVAFIVMYYLNLKAMK